MAEAKRPYRVVIWGPGGLGQTNIIEILRRPELELVGVRGYTDAKNGRDIGDLVGVPLTGITVTTDPEQIFNLDADVVLHTVRESPDHELIHRDVCRILESGKNVISSVEYFPAMFDTKLQRRIEHACHKGNSSVCGAGIHPGLLGEYALMLTATTMDVDKIVAAELVTSDGGSPELLTAFGFAQPPEALAAGSPVAQTLDRIYRPTAAHLANELWGGVQRIEHHIQPILAKDRVVAKSLTCEAGTVAALIMRWDAYGRDNRCASIEEVWYLDSQVLPYNVNSSYEFRIDIKGDPIDASMRIALDHGASTLHRSNGTHIGHAATATSMIQVIPRVCAAPPGILFPEVFAHAKADLRELREPSLAGIMRPL